MTQNPRYVIDTALFNTLAAVQWETLGSPPALQGFAYTSMHFLSWDNFSQNQPAMFLRRISENVISPKGPMLLKYTLKYECWVYAQVVSNDPTQNPYAALDPMIDAIDSALGASPASGKNTLGGVVNECYINGTIVIADGSDDGQAVIRIPIDAITAI